MTTPGRGTTPEVCPACLVDEGTACVNDQQRPVPWIHEGREAPPLVYGVVCPDGGCYLTDPDPRLAAWHASEADGRCCPGSHRVLPMTPPARTATP